MSNKTSTEDRFWSVYEVYTELFQVQVGIPKKSSELITL